MDWTCGAQCVVSRLMALGQFGHNFGTWMTSDDNDHLGQNDRQVKLYKPIVYFNRTTDLVMEPIIVLYYNERT